MRWGRIEALVIAGGERQSNINGSIWLTITHQGTTTITVVTCGKYRLVSGQSRIGERFLGLWSVQRIASGDKPNGSPGWE